MRTGRAIGPVGAFGRAILAFVFLGVLVVAPEGGAFEWREAALGLVVAPAAAIAWQLLRLRWTSEQMDATGPVGFVVNFAIAAAAFMFLPTRDAAFLFYAAALLLAAIRGYAGCEVLAVSNWLLRREDQVGCVVFSPIDAIEARATSGNRG